MTWYKGHSSEVWTDFICRSGNGRRTTGIKIKSGRMLGLWILKKFLKYLRNTRLSSRVYSGGRSRKKRCLGGSNSGLFGVYKT